jgi:RimJ/RimL family protein N-acetyltransferase
VIVRPATDADSADIFAWRNDPLTRHMSLNSDAVSWRDHQNWFATSLENAGRWLLLCEENSVKLAVVRFDIDGANALVSINLNPEARGKSLAKPCLQSAIEYLQSHTSGIRGLTAEIKQENAASRRVFEQVGFEIESSAGGVFTYALTL